MKEKVKHLFMQTTTWLFVMIILALMAFPALIGFILHKLGAD